MIILDFLDELNFQLAKRLAKHPLAQKVVANTCHGVKAEEMAVKLDVPAAEVDEAFATIRRECRKILDEFFRAQRKEVSGIRRLLKALEGLDDTDETEDPETEDPDNIENTDIEDSDNTEAGDNNEAEGNDDAV